MVVSSHKKSRNYHMVSYGVLTLLECFCSYSSMKLLYSVVCISIILFCIATILSLYEVMTEIIYI